MSRRLLFEATGEQVGGVNGATYVLYDQEGRTVEVFADGAQGLSAVGQIVKFNFFTRGGPPAQKLGEVEERDVAVRLVMSINDFFGTADWMKTIADDLRQRMRAETSDDAKGS